MRLAVGALLLGLLLGYLGSRYGPFAPNVRAIVDTQTIIVHSVDSAESVRRGFDAEAKREIHRLETTATLHQLDAAAQRHTADSLASLTDNLTLGVDSLRTLVTQERVARQQEAVALHLALDAVTVARDSAIQRWVAADSAARSLTNELHAALDRLVTVSRLTRKCGVGMAGPVGLSQQGLGLALAAGLSCRL